MQRVARNVRANNYTSASMVCITLDGIFVIYRGLCTLCLIRIVAAATINFALSFVRLLIEGGSYSRAATITARQYRTRARTRNNCVRTYVYERACPPYDIAP